MKTRVRFAPSPTGYLHIGGARTALFNWLFARHTGGTFVLRVEDTDAQRNSLEAVEVILQGLRWLGLDWDEGPSSANAGDRGIGDYGPYFQSQRKKSYQEKVEKLLARDLAYEQEGAVKFRMPREAITIHDLVVGDVRRELTDREQVDPDFVIVRSDGEPVFHLVNVVDDLEMKITHVIRGEDHLSNTAKHIALFNAFGVSPPEYAHIPLILNQDGSKMSKRDTGASLATYWEENYLPEAVVNFLSLMGWSPKNNREKISIPELIQLFDLPQILRHNARFDLAKLTWLNGEYARELSDDRFYPMCLKALQRGGLDLSSFSESYVKSALETCQGKFKLFSELPAYAGFYFREVGEYDSEAAAKEFTSENRPRLQKLREALANLEPFTHESVGATIAATAKDCGVKTGVLVHPTRLACCGTGAGPSLYHLIAILGKERTLARIDAALARFPT